MKERRASLLTEGFGNMLDTIGAGMYLLTMIRANYPDFESG